MAKNNVMFAELCGIAFTDAELKGAYAEAKLRKLVIHVDSDPGNFDHMITVAPRGTAQGTPFDQWQIPYALEGDTRLWVIYKSVKTGEAIGNELNGDRQFTRTTPADALRAVVDLRGLQRKGLAN
jgi:hypothetical protein